MKSLNYNKVFNSKKYFMIPKHVHVIIDRPLGTYHPKHKNIFYSLNYGYVEGVMGGDGEEQDVYVMGVDEPLETFDGDVIAVIHRKNDVEDKRVVAPEGVRFSVDEIGKQTNFQEQFFESEIELVDQCLVVNFNEGKK